VVYIIFASRVLPTPLWCILSGAESRFQSSYCTGRTYATRQHRYTSVSGCDLSSRRASSFGAALAIQLPRQIREFLPLWASFYFRFQAFSFLALALRQVSLYRRRSARVRRWPTERKKSCWTRDAILGLWVQWVLLETISNISTRKILSLLRGKTKLESGKYSVIILGCKDQEWSTGCGVNIYIFRDPSWRVTQYLSHGGDSVQYNQPPVLWFKYQGSTCSQLAHSIFVE